MSLLPRRRRWPRRIVYSLLAPPAAVGLALIIYVYSGHPEAMLRERLTEALVKTLGRPVAVERVALAWLPPGVTIEGLSAETPRLAARRIEASFSLRALLAGRILVKDLDVYDPVLEWDVDSGRLLAPRPAGERPEGRVASRVSLRRLRLHGGNVRIGSQRHEISAAVDHLSLTADNSNDTPGAAGIRGPWEGSLNFKSGRFTIDDLSVGSLAGSVSFESDAEVTRAQRLRVKAEGVDVRGTGVVQPGTPVRARIDLSMIFDPEAPTLSRPLHQFGAREVSADMRITLSGEGARVAGRFVADEPTIDLDRVPGANGPQPTWAARSGTGTYAVGSGRIDIEGRLESFSGGTLEGTYVGVAARPGAPRAHDVALKATALSLEEVLRHYDLPGADEVAPSAHVSGTARARWSGSDVDGMTGEASLALEPVGGDLPVTGTATLAWKGRKVTITSSSLDTAGSHAEITGLVDASAKQMGLDLSGRLVSDDTDPLSRFVERRFGRIPGEPSGSLRATFRIGGTTARPDVRAAFDATGLTVALPAIGTTPGAGARVPIALSLASGRLTYQPDLLSLQVERAQADALDLSAAVKVDTRKGAILALDLDATQAPADLLARLAGLDPATLRAEGTAAATAALEAGPRGGPTPAGLRGDIRLAGDRLVVNGLELERVKAAARLEPRALRLAAAGFDLFGGHVEASGEIGLRQDGPPGGIDVKISRIDLAAIDAKFGGPAMSGHLDASGRLTPGRPGSIEATMAGTDVSIAGISLGKLEGALGGPTDRVRVDLRDAAGRLAATGTLSAPTGAGGIGLDATVTARRFGLEEIRPLLPPGALAGLKGDADGTVTVRGPALDPASLEIHALLDRINLTAGDYTLHNEGPVSLTEANGFLTLAPARLTGERTDLTLGGSMALSGSHEITARVQGSFDLGLIEVLFPDTRASGPGTADLGVIQRGDTLTYTGTLSLEDCTVVHPSLPLPLTNLAGRGAFTEQGQFRIEQAGFDMGGGHVVAAGSARFEGARMPELHLELTGRGLRSELFPELRAFFDADMTLDKQDEDYGLAGKVTIQRAVYSRPFGVGPSELLLRSREFAPTRQRAAGAPVVSLDIEIAADGDVWVRNEDALIEAAAHLSLEGTLDRPELSGRISALEGGTYRFRDVTYRIVGGSLDFADVTRIDPLIDIEAATRVQQYEVTLHITGRFSKPLFELTSDPPLPQRDVVFLLLTGHTLAETPGTEASRTITEGQVAAYLAAPVTGAVAAPLEKALGVSSVQIDPYFLNGTADPTARLTVTKRVATDLLFTYSSSLGQGGQEIYQIEYNPGRLWDLLATRDIDGSVGADMRFRRRWEGLRPTTPPALQPQADGAPAGETISDAPLRLRVGRISIVADHLVDSENSLVRKLPFDENDQFRRGDLLEGRETLRQHYVGHGYPAAEVDVIEEDRDPARPDRVDVRYVVRAEPRHTLEIDGEARKRPIRRAVKTAWKEPILLEDLVEEARKAALGVLQGKGFFLAKVSAGIETPAPDRRLVRIGVEPGPKVRVRRIEIAGNAGIETDRIRHQMLTREGSWIDVFGLNGSLLRESVLKADLDAIRGLYQANGYLSVKVAPPEIRLSEDAREADVFVRIDEGPQSRIEAVSIEGEAAGASPSDLLQAISLSSTQVISARTLELAADRLLEELDRKGYRNARVDYRLEGSPERTRVIFSITPLERSRVRSVTIEGNTRTHSGVVRREVMVKEGEYLSRASVLTTQRNLYRLGVFRSVQVDTEPVEGRADLVNVRIRLQEGAPLMTAWGVGYDTEDRARATFEVADNNLFGTRRSAALFLRESAVDRRVQVTLRDPNLFAEKIETLLSAFGERQEFESFDLRRFGAAAQLSRKVGEHVTLFGRYRLEDVDLFNLEVTPEETGQQTARLGSIASSAAWDTRDDIVNPVRGGISTFDARLYSHNLGSEASFTRVFASAATFKHIGRGVVWASSVRAGLILEPGNPALSNVPISERFFAGGDTTLRGFEFNTVGPKDPATAKPIGGNGLFLFNQELRYPILKALKGVVFYDAGNVYAHRRNYDITDVRHVLGIGLRFDTPVGPFRIEYGRKMDRERFCREIMDDPNTPVNEHFRDCIRDSPGEFFFSIGQAF